MYCYNCLSFMYLFILPVSFQAEGCEEWLAQRQCNVLLYASRKYSLYKEILNWRVLFVVDWNVDNFHKQFLCAFAKLLKRTASFIMSARLSVCPHEKSRLPLNDFSLNFMCEYFLKNCLGNSSLTKIWQEKPVLHMKTNIHFYPNFQCLKWEIFQTNIVEKIKTRFTFNYFFLKKIVPFIR
jgi:hypothetical protein